MRSIKHSSLKLALAAALASASVFALAPAANAGTATGTLSVSASVTAACTVGFAAGLVLTGPSNAQNTTMNVNCTTGSSFNIAFNGAHDQAPATHTDANHYMTNGASFIGYNLTLTSSATTPGTITHSPESSNGTNVAVTSGTGTGAIQAYTITATAIADGTANTFQNATPGSYSDTITAQVTF